MTNESQENLDMDLVAELELKRLHRQYRIMEGDKGAFAGESNVKIQRARKTIRILKNEQNNIIADLQVATSDAKKLEDEKISAHLNILLEKYDSTDHMVKTEKSHLNELDYQIKRIEKEVQEARKNTITDTQCQERVVAAEKTVGQLENRLEVAVVKFNTVVAENFKLRQEIDHLLIERAHFNSLWEKLISCLNQGKKFMLDLIEQATLAYDQREEWCNKLQALRQKGHQDLVAHTQEMRELQRKLDHDAKLQEFLGTKGQKRIMADLEAREARKRQEAKDNMERQLALYRETLSQIQDFCGESDIEKLAAKFIKQEEENFALFNYVNELNHESECLSYVILDLKKNIDEQRELNNKREEQQQNTLDDMEKDLEDEKMKAADAKTKLQKFDTDLATVLTGITKIFNLIKCTNAPILELLGDKTDITPYNVLMYIGLIEKRITELMQFTYFKERQPAEGRSKRAKFLMQQPIIKPDFRTRYRHNPVHVLVPTQPCPLCVEQEQVSDVIDTLQCARSEKEVVKQLNIRLGLPHALDRLHNVSACHLPQSRRIIQQRYQ